MRTNACVFASCRVLSVAGAVMAVTLAGTGIARAQSPVMAEHLRRIFVAKEFASKSFGPAKWLREGQAYATVESSPSVSGAKEIVRYDTASGQRTVLVTAEQATPPGAKAPLTIDDYAWSEDMSRVLIYTNSKRVWRENTRGDYWVLDVKTGALRKLGNDPRPSNLMFAKFSPDGSRVAYVRDNNIYVQELGTGAIIRLTFDGSEKIINGTSDWVYEEEFFVRDGFRWSPDGKRIAYWRFDTTGVENFTLIYDVGAPYEIETQIPYPDYGRYPKVKQIPYPQPGTANSAVRVGVVPAAGGETRWMKVPGSPSDNYIARMEWAGDSDALVLQHLNRLQNTNDVLLADVRTGEVRSVYQDHDMAWVDVVDDLHWVHGGKDFLWLSEQDGWQHVYVISRDGKEVRLATPERLMWSTFWAPIRARNGSTTLPHPKTRRKDTSTGAGSMHKVLPNV